MVANPSGEEAIVPGPRGGECGSNKAEERCEEQNGNKAGFKTGKST